MFNLFFFCFKLPLIAFDLVQISTKIQWCQELEKECTIFWRFLIFCGIIIDDLGSLHYYDIERSNSNHRNGFSQLSQMPASVLLMRTVDFYS